MVKLTSGERIDQVFMISQPQLRTTTRGDYYIAAFLSDRTGRVNGRMWQASEAIFQSLPQEGFARVKGRTENYQGKTVLFSPKHMFFLVRVFQTSKSPQSFRAWVSKPIII